MPIAPQKPINTAAPSIFTVTAQDFQQNVLMGSMQRPVLAYFTAAWCGPCKQLRPVLEKAVMALGGKVGLAVIDIDANQDLAAAMRVQSVPQIYAFVNGQPVDGFMGMIPESQVKAFLNKLLAMMGQEAEEEATGDDPFAFARTAWSDGNLPEAISIYKAIEDQKPRAEKAAAFLQSLMAHGAPDALAKAKTAVEKNPKDAAAQHALALAALAQGQFDTAFDALLASIKVDRKWEEERARNDFVTLSEILGLEDEQVIANRRKLSSILFS
ncbi:MAG TPA: tetratricopeptide repeat protein [Alphaproteobacteria bacterium]|nr:tetratricopeptide repeat protein [Alphaproteobacteria bacterium]